MLPSPKLAANVVSGSLVPSRLDESTKSADQSILLRGALFFDDCVGQRYGAKPVTQHHFNTAPAGHGILFESINNVSAIGNLKRQVNTRPSPMLRESNIRNIAAKLSEAFELAIKAVTLGLAPESNELVAHGHLSVHPPIRQAWAVLSELGLAESQLASARRAIHMKALEIIRDNVASRLKEEVMRNELLDFDDYVAFHSDLFSLVKNRYQVDDISWHVMRSGSVFGWLGMAGNPLIPRMHQGYLDGELVLWAYYLGIVLYAIEVYWPEGEEKYRSARSDRELALALVEEHVNQCINQVINLGLHSKETSDKVIVNLQLEFTALPIVVHSQEIAFEPEQPMWSFGDLPKPGTPEGS